VGFVKLAQVHFLEVPISY